MTLKREDIEGAEFDWFAVDESGRIALCSTAGYGEVPTSVLASSTEEASPMGAIEELVARLPIVGTASSEGRGPGSCEEWPALAMRGMFVYDWKHWNGPYERIVRPSSQLTLSAIPDDLVAKLLLVEVGFSFAETAAFAFQGNRPSAL